MIFLRLCKEQVRSFIIEDDFFLAYRIHFPNVDIVFEEILHQLGCEKNPVCKQ